MYTAILRNEMPALISADFMKVELAAATSRLADAERVLAIKRQSVKVTCTNTECAELQEYVHAINVVISAGNVLSAAHAVIAAHKKLEEAYVKHEKNSALIRAVPVTCSIISLELERNGYSDKEMMAFCNAAESQIRHAKRQAAIMLEINMARVEIFAMNDAYASALRYFSDCVLGKIG
jgi:hypothetical protein